MYIKNPSAPMNEKNKERRYRADFVAVFMIGGREHVIFSNDYGYCTREGRWEKPSSDLKKYLKESSNGNKGEVNERIAFASWANSEEEFCEYLSLFFNLKFYPESQAKPIN